VLGNKNNTYLNVILLVIFIVCFNNLSAQDKFAKNFISDSLVHSIYYSNLYEVNEINFIGNEFFSKNYLFDIINTKRTARSLHHKIFEYYYLNLREIDVAPKKLVNAFYDGFKALSHEVKYFNQSLVETDIKIIQEGYNASGYHDCIVYFTFQPNATRTKNILNFHIIENERYKIDTIVYYGLENLDNETKNKINEIEKIKKGTPFSESQIYSEINKINLILLDNGYFYAKYEILPIAVNDKALNDSITVLFTPGVRQKIKSIKYIDSLRNQNEIVQSLKDKLVEIKEDDWFSISKLQNSLNNLNVLGVFESVQIDTSSIFDAITDSTLSFIVRTNYKKQKEWSVGLFLNNTQINNFINFGVEGSIFHRNWGGAAQFGNVYANLQAKNVSRILSGAKSEFEGQIGLRIFQPLVWELENMRISLSGGFYYSYTTINQLFNISSWNFPLRIPIKLTNETYLNQIILDFNFEFQNPVNFLDVQNSLNNNDEPKGNNDYLIRYWQSYNLYQTLYFYLNDPGYKFLTSNSFGLTLIGDSRNHPFSPTNGDYFYGSIDGWNFFLAHPWISGIAKYLRVQAAYSLFQKVEDNSTLAFKIRGGIIKIFDTEKAYIPFDRQFYAGGANSVRGWSSRELHYSVLEANTDTTSKNFILPEDYSTLSNIIGSLGLLEGSVELRITIPKPRGVDEIIADQLSKFGFVIFVDFGNAYNWLAETGVKSDIKWYEYITKVAWAGGIGIRYDTPIGPIRADLGIPIFRPNYNLPDYMVWRARNLFSDIRIHFGIGHAF